MKKLFAWAIGSFIASTLAGACGGSGSDSGGSGGGSNDASVDVPIFVPEGGKEQRCKQTCADLGANCGPQGDGCGNVIDCGTCTLPDVCGIGGPSKCGNPNPDCVPKTCEQLKAECGPQANGCGSIVDCGTCAAGTFCGGAGPSKCGPGTGGGTDGGTCKPTKTACASGDCGPIGNGCGQLIQCSPNCPAGQICGGGGVPSKCGGGTLTDGGSICKPKTCAQLGKNCGPVGDGCGKLLNCGSSCPSGQICGGGGVPSVCGPVGTVTDGGACTGLCQQQVKCDGGGTTTLSGVVFAPNGIEPLPNAVVYVPNGGAAPDYGVQAFSQGVACNRCGADVTGNPLVKTISDFDGSFTLTNVPVGQNIPLVIQLGRWRRMTTINVASPCADNQAAPVSTRLPRTQGEFGIAQNNIPLTAIATGGVDTLECVLRKIGVADSEFTGPNNSGRIHLWQGDNGPSASGYGQIPSTGAVSWSGLYGNQTTLNKYDQLIFACNGDPGQATMHDPDRARVRNYLNQGGRLFASHYEYVWLYNQDNPPNPANPYRATATWNVDQPHPPDPNPARGLIDTSFAKGAVFAQWLGAVGALATTNPPRIDMNISRHDIDPLPNPPGIGIVSPAQRWLSVDPVRPDGTPFPTSYNTRRGTVQLPNYIGAPQHYTFNTPWGAPADQQCGRVLFSDFHVSNASSNGATFPSECSNTALTPQEKVIEFMLFDLGNCITPDAPPPSCTPKTCAQLGAVCGPQGNGCGGTIQCPCPAGQTCGGAGVLNQCAPGPTCTPLKCPSGSCGSIGDGCGSALNCGGCPTGQQCGAGGVPNKCGTAACVPRTCAQMGVTCGPSGDGCGGLIDCGDCPTDCKPRTCADAKADCGQIGDNCGGLIDCGTCVAPATCGGGGIPNVCDTAGIH